MTQTLQPLWALRQAMLNCLEGGQFHVRERMTGTAVLPYEDFVQIGLALKACVLNPARHNELIDRLRPHVDVIIGVLPPGIQSHGLLPLPEENAIAVKPLADWSDALIRQWIVDDGSLVYGELTQEELAGYFEALGPFVTPGLNFVDLGSGLGKVVMTAALSFPFAHCKGVEILPYRHRMAMQRFAQVLKEGQMGFANMSAQSIKLDPQDTIGLPSGQHLKALDLLTLPNRIAFEEADMFACDVSQAQVVFIYSTCFGALMPKIATKLANELPENALVTTTTYTLPHASFELVQHFPAKSLAWTDVFLYRKNSHAQTKTANATAVHATVTVDVWETQARQLLANLWAEHLNPK